MKYLLLLLAPLVVLAAEPKAKKYTLNDLDWGKVIYGPTLTEKTLKDKGMLICLFVSNKDYNPDVILGRVQKDVTGADGKIVGLAVDFNSLLSFKETAELEKLAKKIGVGFTIAVGVKKRPPGFGNFSPYCYVVNSKKAIIYSGSYGGPEFDEAMKEVSTPVTNAGEKSKDDKKDDKAKADPKKAA
jgi:hypothetical protein